MTKRSQSSSSSSSSPTTDGRYARLSRATQGGRASFAECHPEELGSAIDQVIEVGDLLSFSRTSDGGAVCLFIKSRTETLKVYCASQEELAEAIHDLADLPSA